MKKDVKFEELYDVSNWEVETPYGWRNIEKIGRTIPYEKWSVVTETGSELDAADEHILYDADDKEKFLHLFSVGDKVQTRKGLEKITHIENTHVSENMYDLQVEKEHIYWSGDFKSHNTLVMSNFAIELAKDGKNVLYITLEISENDIIERVDANLYNIETHMLSDMFQTKQVYSDKVRSVENSKFGKFVIKEYPTASMNSQHLRALIDELAVREGFYPDFIVVDYIGIMLPTRIVRMDNSYLYFKAIIEELRGFAVERNIGIITAHQTQRKQAGQSDIQLESIANSYAIAETADFALGVVESDSMRDSKRYLFKVLKNRYSPIYGKTCKFVMGVEKEKQRLMELDDPYKEVSSFCEDDDEDIEVVKESDDDIQPSKPDAAVSKYEFKEDELKRWKLDM